MAETAGSCVVCGEVVWTCECVDHGPQDGGRPDHLLQDVGLRSQRETVVQHLLQQLINRHHVVLNDRFGAFSKIILGKYSIYLFNILLK